MTVESVDKRARRAQRMQRELDRYKHALRFFPPYDALSQVVGYNAVWSAVRQLASTLVQSYVRSVPVAWAIAHYVRELPDGEQRLQDAAAETVARWQREINELNGALRLALRPHPTNPRRG